MAGIPDTISEGLGRYSIGEKLRSLRLRKSMGLVELGKHTSLSAALLSKLERGKLFPTLPTLLRIAMVFGVGLDYFFTDERKRRVVGVVRKGRAGALPRAARRRRRAVFLRMPRLPRHRAQAQRLPRGFSGGAASRNSSLTSMPALNFSSC